MTPLEYYQNNITSHQNRQKRIKIRRNLITSSKLLTFGLLVWLIYLLVSGSDFPIVLAAFAIVVLFILLTIADSRIVTQQRQIQELIRINSLEIEYLQGNLTDLPTGSEYQDPTHTYSCDLDVFGEDSLFRHLNRTVTTQGSHKLASWLLCLSKDPKTITDRQQATRELTLHPDYCQAFRASGALHPTQHADLNILQHWVRESPFFKNALRTGVLLYAANTITLCGWLLVALQVIPYSFALLLSLLQLITIAIYLKKINVYHLRLSKFIRSVGNYLPLAELLDNQKFNSSCLLQLQSRLTGKGCHARQAFASLNRIQNGLDQRGNVLLAFLLNGLYMKDLHTLIRLDNWKRKYSHHIGQWMEVISETDALISMANYRYNHPTYCVPQISGQVLLEAIEAGHPLFQGDQCVTNHFRIDTLHQLFIVTGANMAGKSTFLRTIGVNLILAQSGNVVYSSSFCFQPMTLFTSMRTTDNLAKGTSYFHAELLRLSQLVQLASQEDRLFIILDEMLKGTNSVDKLNGSLAFLKKLLTYPISGLVATHDLALGELAVSYPDHFSNICFEITHTDTDIAYDYKLRPGISSTMNASILLKQMGLI